MNRVGFVSKSVTVSAEQRTARFIASTDSEDRHGDIIQWNAFDLTNFKRNPVILGFHAYDAPPVGRALNIEATHRGLILDVQFAPAGINPQADVIWGLISAGAWRPSVSVGFLPLEYERRDDGDGYLDSRVELLEISLVSIPSNPDAVMVPGSAKSAFSKIKGGLKMSETSNSTSGLPRAEVSRRLKSAIDQFARHDLSRGELCIELKRIAIEATGDSDAWEQLGPEINRPVGRFYDAHAKACGICEADEDISDDEAREILNLIEYKLSTIGH
jgi:HK97 family phage prohead protease